MDDGSSDFSVTSDLIRQQKENSNYNSIYNYEQYDNKSNENIIFEIRSKEYRDGSTAASRYAIFGDQNNPRQENVLEGGDLRLDPENNGMESDNTGTCTE